MRLPASALRCPQLRPKRPHLTPGGGWLVIGHFHRGVHTQNARIEDIRNIGIIAHVDAGKTTTTERMLYFSGVTKRLGNVDSGNTVTDFLDMERERGITIQSAAITFSWPPPSSQPGAPPPATINLIDTPGHQDFRFEVDRCLPVLDGAVCVVDAVKGVEAHTERVWAEAGKHAVPRLLFVNKLDRDGASFRRAVLDVAARLGAAPLLCHLPWWDGETFVGVVDVVARVAWRWSPDKGRVEYGVEQLEPALRAEVEVAREKLVEALAEVDEAVMEMFAEDPATIPGQTLKAAIRRAISSGDGKIVPVLAGASFRNIGVEPLMDAIVDYLPNPRERPELEVQLPSGKKALKEVLSRYQGKAQVASVASVFKVFNHPKEGILSFVRVYHGELQKNAQLWNTHMKVSERPLSLVQIAADRTEDIAHLSTGQIGAIKGLKKARTGDTLVSMLANKSVPEPLQHIQIRPPDIPPAVAFLAIDPYGPVAAKEVEAALENISREDPSLRWSHNDKTEQFVLQGMGRLHLEVAVHNMRARHGNIDAEFSPIEVDYKECLTAPIAPIDVVYERVTAGKPGRVTLSVSLEPVEEGELPPPEPRTLRTETDDNIIDVTLPDPAAWPAAADPAAAAQQLVNGAVAALARGPRLGRAVQRCRVALRLGGDATGATSAHFGAAAGRAVRDALRAALTARAAGVLEPVMAVRLACPEEVAGAVQHDITAAAGGQVLEVRDLSSGVGGGEDGAVDMAGVYCPPDPYEAVTSLRGRRAKSRMVEIVARVPFKEMLDYDSRLRSKTAGRHSMTMAFESFERVLGARDKAL